MFRNASRSLSVCVAALALTILIPAVVNGQQGSGSRGPLIIRVVEETTLQPLPNAEVLLVGTSRRHLTNNRGEARFARPGEGRISVRVRQIGFLPLTRDLGSATGDTVVFTLSRVAYELPRVVRTADASCPESPDSSTMELSARVLEQLRLAAERYDFFRREYPFRLEIGRRSAVIDARDRIDLREEVGRSSSNEYRARYRPGQVVVPDRARYRPGRMVVGPDGQGFHGQGFSVPLLFISTLGDSTFWAHHCFVASGIETRDGKPLIRLEFAPSARIRTPDWAGVAFLDSATSTLRRVEFRLTGLKRYDRPRRLEGYSTFATPSPFIVVPDTTLAIWWKREPSPDGDWGDPDVAQMLYIRELTWRRGKPPPVAREPEP